MKAVGREKYYYLCSLLHHDESKGRRSNGGGAGTLRVFVFGSRGIRRWTFCFLADADAATEAIKRRSLNMGVLINRGSSRDPWGDYYG